MSSGRLAAICLAALLAIASRADARQADRSAPGDEDPPRQDSRIRVGPAVLSGAIWIDGTMARQDSGAEDGVRVSRARLGTSGRVGPRLQYNFSTDLTGPSVRGAAVTLTLADLLVVRAGRHNPAATLERSTSPADLEAIGRSIVSSELTSPPAMAISVFSRVPYRGVLGYAANVTRGRGWDWTDPDRSHDVSGRVAITVPRIPNVMIVASGARGRRQGSQRTLAGIGIDGRAGPWHVMAEGLREQRAEGHRSGLMVMAAYGWLPHPTRRFARLEVASRLVTIGSSSWAASGRGWQLGVNHYLTSETRLMAHVSVPIAGRRDDGPSATLRLQAGF